MKMALRLWRFYRAVGIVVLSFAIFASLVPDGVMGVFVTPDKYAFLDKEFNGRSQVRWYYYSHSDGYHSVLGGLLDGRFSPIKVKFIFDEKLFNIEGKSPGDRIFFHDITQVQVN